MQDRSSPTQPAERLTRSFSNFLNAARWLAALAVVLFHARLALVGSYSELRERSYAARSFFFITGFGPQAVIIFFVISGLLVGGLTLERWRGTGPNLRQYFTTRFARIYIVLIPALLLTTLVSVFVGPGLTTDQRPQFVMTALGHLFMAQGVWTPLFPVNDPLWSLACEWWYYALFAFALAAVTTRGALERSSSLLIVFALLVLLPGHVTILAGIWFLGILLLFYGRSNWPVPRPWLGWTVFAIGMAWTRSSGGQANFFIFDRDLGRDLLAAVSFCVLAASHFRRDRPDCTFSVWNERLAAFSYTVYAVHAPILVMLVSTKPAGRLSGEPLSARHMMIFAIQIGLVYVCAWLMFLVFERNTSWLRKQLLKLSSPDKMRA